MDLFHEIAMFLRNPTSDRVDVFKRFANCARCEAYRINPSARRPSTDGKLYIRDIVDVNFVEVILTVDFKGFILEWIPLLKSELDMSGEQIEHLFHEKLLEAMIILMGFDIEENLKCNVLFRLALVFDTIAEIDGKSDEEFAKIKEQYSEDFCSRIAVNPFDDSDFLINA